MGETTFIGDFKRAFLTGLAALFPILITVFLLIWFYHQLDRTIGSAVNSLCQQVIVARPALFETVFPNAPPEVVDDPDTRKEYARDNFPGFVGVSIGILGALVLVYLTGVILRSYGGGRIVGGVDGFFARFPVIRAIYPHARQMGDFLLGTPRNRRFLHVVAVEYPRRGAYSVGFLTGTGIKDIAEKTGRDVVTVFIPTSPAPLTGYVVVLPRDEVMEIDMSVEEAFRFCMSAGMVATAKQRPGEVIEVDRAANASALLTPTAEPGMVESTAGKLSKEEMEDQ
jgi:uncharacterized membrane protein